jgi:hypothetical protein
MFELEAGAFVAHLVTEDAAYFGSTSSSYGIISLAEVRSKISMTMKKKNKKLYYVIRLERVLLSYQMI